MLMLLLLQKKLAMFTVLNLHENALIWQWEMKQILTYVHVRVWLTNLQSCKRLSQSIIPIDQSSVGLSHAGAATPRVTPPNEYDSVNSNGWMATTLIPTNLLFSKAKLTYGCCPFLETNWSMINQYSARDLTYNGQNFSICSKTQHLQHHLCMSGQLVTNMGW